MSTTTIITTPEELERFEYNGVLADGALVRDANRNCWIAWDTEDGAMCLRPRGEDEPRIVVPVGAADLLVPVLQPLQELLLPLTITIEENQS